ncbi:MAG: hypothetical protein KIT74_00010 [Fimbriimonadales bacterium]|nr:hypothetical protein [Fimbriimonadales bacterium]
MKRPIFALCLTVFVIAPLMAQRPGTPTVLAGEVVAFVSAGEARMLFRDDERKLWTVLLAPSAALNAQPVSLGAGMRVIVDGFDSKLHQDPTLFARIIYTDTGEIVLRNTNGELLWSPPERVIREEGEEVGEIERGQDNSESDFPRNFDSLRDWMSTTESLDFGGGIRSWNDGAIIQIASGPVVLNYRAGSMSTTSVRRFVVGSTGLWRR